jgi:hypothetical protein
MDEEAQGRVLERYNHRILALAGGKAKLEDRRRAVILSNAEDLQINAGLLRMDAAIRDLLDEKAALRLSTKSISAPSAQTLADMRAAVEAIHALNAASRRTSAIIAAVVEVAGSLPRAPAGAAGG